MRILLQCNCFLPSRIGGVEVLTYHLARGLQQRGHEILVISEATRVDRVGPQEYGGVKLVRLDFTMTMAARNLPAMRRVSEELAATVSAFAPDVLHLNDTGFGSLMFLRGGASGQLPRLFTLHSPIRFVQNSLGLQERMVNDADIVSAVSRFHLASVLATLPSIADRTSVVLNALPPPPVAPKPLPFSPPVVLGLGRIVGDKGFDTALHAFAMLKRRGVEARYRIVGEGDARADLEQLAADLGLGADISFLDGVAPDAVAALMNEATMIVVPSRWDEPFGLVALEAAQLGRPVVASAVGGLPEIVEHGETGFLVPKDNPEALAGAIARIVTDPAEANRLGQNACRHAAEAFNFDALLDAYEGLYLRAIGAGGSRDSLRPARAGHG